MKHKRSLISIAMVTLVLVSLCAVCASPLSVSAAQGGSANAQPSAAITGVPYFTGAPAVCAPSANSLDLFVKGTSITTGGEAGTFSADGALWWRHWDGAVWYGWTSLGGILTSDPVAVSQGAGKVDVFVRGADGALWQKEYNNNAWGGWTSLGGIIYPGTGPAVSSSAGRLDVFVEGTDGALWHKSFNGAWSGWESLGGILTSSPVATSPGNGVIDVFVRGTDAGLWQVEYNNNAWGGWTSLGEYLTSSPAATSRSSGTIDVFVSSGGNLLQQGVGGGVWQREYSNNGWSSWIPLGWPPIG